jgi:serine/threonine-protein kinase
VQPGRPTQDPADPRPATVEDDLDLELIATIPASSLADAGRQRREEAEGLVGTVLGERYRLIRLIGQGGMGAVYQAEHAIIGKTIAVKVLASSYSRNPGDVQRFLQEARAASLIRHDHVVDIADFGYTPRGQAYLVMEYLEGEDLAQTLQREGALPWLRVSDITTQIGSALAAAHAKGIIHRDMKPENCFRVRREGDADYIKVLDFGIAKIVDDRFKRDGQESLTIEGGIIGTPEYVAPELCRGQKADARVDIYALGIIMYRMLTGVLPFRTDTDNYMAVLSQHLTDEPVPPRQQAPGAGIPARIEAIVLRALAKDPDRRYQKVEELIAALRAAQLELTGSSATAFLDAPNLQDPRTIRPPDRAALARVVGLAVVVVLAGGVIAWELLGGRAPREEPPPPPVAVAPAPPPVAPSPPPVVDAGSTGGDPTGGLEPTTGGDAPAPGRAAEVLSAAEFRRTAAALQRSLKSKCPGLPGFEVGAKVYVEASGRVSRVVPEGRQAGSSFSACVAKLIRGARFKRARRSSVHTATFRL